MSFNVDAVGVRNADGTQVAAQVLNVPAPGKGLPALAVDQEDSTGAVLALRGGGTLISAVNSSGTSKFKVDNSGNVTAGGSVSTAGVTGSKAWLYQYLEPAGTLAASVDGRMSATSTAAALASGTVYPFALPVESGLTISNLTLVSLTAEATGTHAWVGLADNTGTVLAISADKTAAAYFAGNTAVTTALAAPLVTTYTGLYYAFVCVVASGTMPTFASAPAFTHAAIATVPPIICGTALTSQTTPVAVGSSLGTITPTAGHQIYAYCT